MSGRIGALPLVACPRRPGQPYQAMVFAKEEEAHGGIHMPFGSIWPFVAALGMLIVAVGATCFTTKVEPGIGPKLALTLIGGAVTLIGIYFWSLEGNEGYHIHLDKDGKATEDHGHGSHGKH